MSRGETRELNDLPNPSFLVSWLRVEDAAKTFSNISLILLMRDQFTATVSGVEIHILTVQWICDDSRLVER